MTPNPMYTESKEMNVFFNPLPLNESTNICVQE